MKNNINDDDSKIAAYHNFEDSTVKEPLEDSTVKESSLPYKHIEGTILPPADFPKDDHAADFSSWFSLRDKAKDLDSLYGLYGFQRYGFQVMLTAVSGNRWRLDCYNYSPKAGGTGESVASVLIQENARLELTPHFTLNYINSNPENGTEEWNVVLKSGTRLAQATFTVHLPPPSESQWTFIGALAAGREIPKNFERSGVSFNYNKIIDRQNNEVKIDKDFWSYETSSAGDFTIINDHSYTELTINWDPTKN